MTSTGTVVPRITTRVRLPSGNRLAIPIEPMLAIHRANRMQGLLRSRRRSGVDGRRGRASRIRVVEITASHWRRAYGLDMENGSACCDVAEHSTRSFADLFTRPDLRTHTPIDRRCEDACGSGVYRRRGIPFAGRRKPCDLVQRAAPAQPGRECVVRRDPALQERAAMKRQSAV